MNKNIIITSAGRRVSLVNAFKAELKKLTGTDSKVFTTDLNPALSSACMAADGFFKVGRFTDLDYIDVLINLCKENNIAILIPTIDTELLLLAENKSRFEQIGTDVILSDITFIKTCRDKRLTNKFFEKHSINVPIEFTKDNLSFPVFIKPFNGSSSNGLLLANDADDISKNVLCNENMMFLEYLSKKDYDEYTIDIYYNRSGIIKSIIPRLRIQTRQGEMSKGLTVKNHLINFVLDNLNNNLNLRGCITLQVFNNKDTNEIYGIEINPRFGGGYPLSYLAGANFPEWIIKEYIKKEEIDFYDSWQNNLLLLRHDNEMIIENYANK